MKKVIRLIFIGLVGLFSLNAFSANFPQTCSGVTGSAVAGKYIVTACTNSPNWSNPNIANAGGCFIQVCTGSNSNKVLYNASWATNNAYVCPTNSTKVSGQCSPNSGYSAVYNPDTFTWSVVPTGTECQSGQTYNSITGDCEGTPIVSCGDINNPSTNASCTCEAPLYKRASLSGGYRCSAGADLELVVAGYIVGALGLSVALVTGLFTSLLACTASIICAGALTVAGLGAALEMVGWTLDANPSSNVNPAAQLQVTIAEPNTPTPPPQNNKIRIGGQGELVPPLNATQDPSTLGRYTWTQGTTTATIDTNTNTASISDSSEPNMLITMATNGSPSATVTKSTLTPFGTSANGTSVKKATTSKTTVSNSNINPDVQTQTQYIEGDNITNNPPPMGICTDPTCGLGGNGGTDPENTGGGDCDKEPTKCQILTNILSTLRGQGTDGEVAIASFEAQQDTLLDDFQGQAQTIMQDFYNSDLWATEFLGALNDTPNPMSYLASKSGSCTFSFNAPGGQQELDMCPHLGVIHPAIAFGTFILLMFGIRDLILEKETT